MLPMKLDSLCFRFSNCYDNGSSFVVWHLNSLFNDVQSMFIKIRDFAILQ